MKSLAFLAALALVPAPASAALNPKQVRTVIYAGVGAVGVLVYNAERIHHKADTARDAAIQEALLERNARLEGQLDATRYVCSSVAPDGTCATFTLRK